MSERLLMKATHVCFILALVAFAAGFPIEVLNEWRELRRQTRAQERIAYQLENYVERADPIFGEVKKEEASTLLGQLGCRRDEEKMGGWRCDR